MYGEVDQVLAPVGNPLPWTLGPELGQVPFERRKACCPKSTCGSTVISPSSLVFAADPTKIPRPPVLPGSFSRPIEFTLAKSFRLCSSLIAGCESCGGEIASANRHSKRFPFF